MDPLFFDSHVHTPFCRHAIGEPGEYIAAAEERGIRGLIVTCHSPMPDGWAPHVRMKPEQFEDYVQYVRRAAREGAGRVEIRLGLECDYAPGLEDWLRNLVNGKGLNYVLGSVHPHLSPYKDTYFQGDMRSYQSTYFEHVALAAESGLFHAIAHPDVIKTYFPKDWRLEDVMDDVRRMLDRVAKTGVALELNTSGLRKDFAEMNPGPEILREMRARAIPVVLGSDAHAPNQVAFQFEAALTALEDAGYSSMHYYIEGRQHQIGISEAKASLRTDS